MYSSRIINKDDNKEDPSLVNQQCVVYWFKCDLCDAGYVSYICQHQQIEEHKDRQLDTTLESKMISRMILSKVLQF